MTNGWTVMSSSRRLVTKKFYKEWDFVLGVRELDAVEGKLPPFHRNLRDDVAGNHLEYVSSPKSHIFWRKISGFSMAPNLTQWELLTTIGRK